LSGKIILLLHLLFELRYNFVSSFLLQVNFATNFVIGMTFPSLQSLMGVYVFAIFAVGTFAQAVFLFFKLPETFRPPRSFSSAATILH
jgi:hypothetical protein